MIRSVFRVQCDGPCKGWLSWSQDYVPGTDMLPGHHVVAPTAERALNWPGERVARLAALSLGWKPDRRDAIEPRRWLCPDCKHNPLGIVLPPDMPAIADAVKEVQEQMDEFGRRLREAMNDERKDQ